MNCLFSSSDSDWVEELEETSPRVAENYGFVLLMRRGTKEEVF